MRYSIIVLLILIPITIFSQSNRPNRTEFSKYPGSRQKKEERVYKSNKLVSWKQWYEDGTNKMRKSFTTTGKKHGKWIEWYSNGVKKYEITYSNDSIIGISYEWYEDGFLKYEKQHENNKLVHLKFWNTEHYLEYEEEYKIDENKTILHEYQWYLNKKMKEEKISVNGDIFSRTSYYGNGTKHKEEEYYLGRVHGKSLEYWENGNLMFEKIYDQGVVIKITKFNEAGIKTEVNIIDEKKYNKVKEKY